MRYFLIQYQAMLPDGATLMQNLGYELDYFPSGILIEEDATERLSEAGIKEFRFSVAFIFEFKSEQDYRDFYAGETLDQEL